MDSDEKKPAGKGMKWLKEIGLLLGMLALSAGIAFILTYFKEYFDIELRNFGWIAYVAVFIANILSSATILVPAPGVAITLAAASVFDPMFVAIAAGTGDAIGEMTAYSVGYAGERIIVDEHMPAYRKAASWMDKYGVWAIFGIALVPILPYDLIGMAAGALKIAWWKCFLATLSGKLPRAFIVSYMGYQMPFLLHPFGL
ncbi:MAG: VTT domain-containing protein [Dehalococcoidia bacterium]|nr:VTT domain-containing protein [Dehalococcoidia bacterium]